MPIQAVAFAKMAPRSITMDIVIAAIPLNISPMNEPPIKIIGANKPVHPEIFFRGLPSC
jgi:hypothetical protein